MNKIKTEQQLLNELRTELGFNANTIKRDVISKNAQKLTNSKITELNTLLNRVREVNVDFDNQLAKVNAKRHNLTLKEYNDLLDKANRILRSFNSGFRTGDFKTLILNGKLLHFIDEREHLGKGIKSGVVDLELNKKQLRELQPNHNHWYFNINEKEVIYIAELGHKEDFRLELRKGELLETGEIQRSNEKAPVRIK